MWVEGPCPRCAPKPKKKRPYLTGTAHPYFIDLTGQIFTRLTVEKYAGDSRWVCQCQCGATSIVRGKHLRKGRIRSCGCLQRELTGQLLRKDLTGRVFGHLTVTSFAFSRRSNAYWNCQCDCGATAIIAATSLTTGATRSCGCMHWKVPPEVMRAAGLKRERDWQPAGLAPTAERKRVLDAIEKLGWPVFVKPARGGSSIGTSRAANIGELHEAIEIARQHDPKVLVEAAITGSEIECSVLEGLDGGAPDASLPGQLDIDGGEQFYDFDAKYFGGTRMTIPARIPPEDIGQIRRLAAAAFEAVSCEGLARVDFFYTPDRKIVVNEINTMPGMTASSYFAKMWEATGLGFDELIGRLLETALRKRSGLR